MAAFAIRKFCRTRSAVGTAATAPRFCSSSSASNPPPAPSPPPFNPPDAENPDPVTLREQWSYAIRLYSKWYSHAWGTAILAGLSFFALGWFVKGKNPLLSTTGGKEEKQEKAQQVHDKQ